ncbi:hypothetical protein TWF694_005986 [Orbilia ellipsospora]|uniref:Uncharacterized protein n=1 Tax=Orbilia ellipsospora TaxID=2528407 RepID=A0AAV9WR38_9PEZI
MNPRILLLSIFSSVSAVALTKTIYTIHDTDNTTYVLVASPKDSENQQGLPWASVLSAFVFIMMGYYLLRTAGFNLRRRWLTTRSTDFLVAVTLCCLSQAWMATVMWQVFGANIEEEGKAICKRHSCLKYLIYAPWILEFTSLAWVISFFIKIYTLHRAQVASHNSTRQTKDSGPPKKKLQSTLSRWFWPAVEPGYAEWATFVGGGFHLVLSLMALAGTGFSMYASWSPNESATLMLMSLVGCIIFTFDLVPANPLAYSPHYYAADTIRVVCPTREQYDIVYILPSAGRGFDAVYSPKIAYEHKRIEKKKKKGIGQRDGHPKLLEDGAIFSIFDRMIASIQMNNEEVDDLAMWLYFADNRRAEGNAWATERLKMEKYTAMWRKDCSEITDNFKNNFVGKNLVLAVWFAEYLLFRKIGMLSKEAKPEACAQLFKWKGEELYISEHAIGNKPGLEGYMEAVQYLCKLLGVKSQHVDPAQKHIYDELWNQSIKEQESTFAALYAFSCKWSEIYGYNNDEGWHIFPLRPKSAYVDLVTWHIFWRQGWYTAIICQLIILVPNFIGIIASWLWI